MSLDLTRVAAQVGAMIAALRNNRADRRRRLDAALRTLADPGIDIGDLKKKIEAGRTSWLVAELVEGLNLHYPAPAAPPDFTVIGADGSHIDVDRHRSTRCYLINTGAAVITYGSRPDAELTSSPRLYSDDSELAITPPGGGREQPVEGTILGIKRSTEECRRLVELAAALPGSSTLALMDGTLLLWGLEAYPDFITDALLTGGFLRCLEELKGLNAGRRVAVASYISFPRSTDVVNALRVAVCPNDVPNCDTYCPPGKERDCDIVAGVRDRDVFMELLGERERSALFISPSKINKQRYGNQLVYFFYLRAGDEIARIEVPKWVAENRELLELTHGLVLDQCRRGHGYPVVLSEAHEQAVVTGADQENFWELVESTLVAERLPSAGSAKSFSKRTRWV